MQRSAAVKIQVRTDNILSTFRIQISPLTALSHASGPVFAAIVTVPSSTRIEEFAKLDSANVRGHYDALLWTIKIGGSLLY